MAALTGEQSCECSGFWLDGFSWLLLVGLGFSSVLLPENVEEDDREDPDPTDLLRLLFIPADDRRAGRTTNIIPTGPVKRLEVVYFKHQRETNMFNLRICLCLNSPVGNF